MTEEIMLLQNKIESLEKENQYLKSLLDQAGISYHGSAETKNMDLFEPDQGKRIIPREIADQDVNLFFSMFWGGGVRMCMQSELSKNPQGRLVITPNATIFGRQAARE